MSKEAETVVFSPPEEGVIVHMLSIEPYRDWLIGKEVKEGMIIDFSDKIQKLIDEEIRKKEKDFYDPFWKDFMTPSTKLKYPTEKLFVYRTEPKGVVKITRETKLRWVDKRPGIPRSRIIEVKTLPKLEKMTEVKSLEDLEKIVSSTNAFINKYEDKKRIIYFVGDYYFLKRK